MNTILGAACTLARAGIPVIPVRRKIPTCPHGLTDGTTDPALIRELFARYPGDGLGAVCGHPLRSSGYLAVLDIDPRHGGDGSLSDLERTHSPLPTTWRVATPSGGWHLYFRTTVPLPTKTGFRCGLDLRAVGSIVVAPPSPGYSIVRRDGVAPMPDWLVGILSPPPASPAPRRPPPMSGTGPRYVAAAIRAECEALASAPEGARNCQLNRSAFALARFTRTGQADATALQDALHWAARQAGLSEREITRTIASAFRSQGAA